MRRADILIIDDDSSSRNLLAAMLRPMGHGIRMAIDGRDGLESAKRFAPDLILLDLMMPVMNGFEFLEARAQDPALRAVPVIIVTAQSDAESATICMKNGAEDYILKPLAPQTVQHRIQACWQAALDRRENACLGSYKIVGIIGSGSVGDVFLAEHALMRRKSALKRLRHHRISERALAMFENEVRLTADLSHPNTIAVYDYGRSPDGTLYYAMEYVDGIDLNMLVSTMAPSGLPDGRVIFILLQICGSLAEAHGKNLIHRDLKASNVMLCTRGGICDFVKILDFGIACTREELANSHNDEVQGTPMYMSPEHVGEPWNMDQRSDIYAIGVLAYYLLTGQTPFAATSIEALLEAHQTTPPIPLAESASIPICQDLQAIVMRCMAKNPADRPQSAKALAAMLQSCDTEYTWDAEQAEQWWQTYGHEVDNHRFVAPIDTGSTLGIDFSDRIYHAPDDTTSIDTFRKPPQPQN